MKRAIVEPLGVSGAQLPLDGRLDHTPDRGIAA